MGKGRGQGAIGVDGGIDVQYEEESSGDKAVPVTDANRNLFVKMRGEDDGGNDTVLSTDSQGRIDLASTPDVNIGDVNLLDPSDNVIDPQVVNEVAGVSALSTDASDYLQIDIPGQPLDVSGATVTLTDEGSFDINSLPSIPAGSNNIGEVNVAENQNNSGIAQGQDTVSSSGTPEALNGGTSLSVPDGAKVAVKAFLGNSGTIYVGDSSVTTSNGFELDPGEAVNLGVDDVSTVFLDVGTGGDGASWIVEQ